VDGVTSTPSSPGADLFTYDSQAPVVKKIIPDHGPTTGGTTVAIVGNHLSTTKAVYFGSTAGTIDSVNSDHAVIATSPPGSGTVTVTVTTNYGTSAPVASSSDQFTYVNNGPDVVSLDPKKGSVDGGTKVTIFGTGLSGASVVDFGSTAGTIDSVDSENSMVVTSPPGTGTVTVTVTTPDGTSSGGADAQFTYEANVPKVNFVIPSHGSTAGGTTVTIGGWNLGKATAVDFGSTPATFTANSGHVITATSPPGSGTVYVTVTNANGTSAVSSSDTFTYIAPSSS
jgi:hypothetical protein